MWAMLGDVAAQVEYYGAKRSPDTWKQLFTAALDKSEVLPNLDGDGFVQIWGRGHSTSKMSKPRLSDLMELISEYGARNGVEFRDECNREAA